MLGQPENKNSLPARPELVEGYLRAFLYSCVFGFLNISKRIYTKELDMLEDILQQVQDGKNYSRISDGFNWN